MSRSTTDAAERTTYTIAVTIDPIGWKKSIEWTSANGPIGREHGTFLIDETARTVMLIGGSGYQPQGMALDDFWKLDLATQTWTKITPSGDAFPPTASARAVRVPKTTTAYLFGGYTGSGMTDTNDLFRVENGAIADRQRRERFAEHFGVIAGVACLHGLELGIRRGEGRALR